MTPTDLKGHCARNTGDLNLAAALMAVGIPLDDADPVAVVCKGSRSYGSFRLLAVSEDGKRDTQAMMHAWSMVEPLPDADPFTRIMQFIEAGKLARLSTPEDWLGFAVGYLQEMQIKLPGLRVLNDIPGFVKALPESFQSYILAFVWNRKLCLDLYNHGRRQVMMSEGRSHSIIDTRLPKWQRHELLSRLHG